MRGDPWSDQRLALLQALWAAGATAQSIADRLGGVSRSAVLGKIFRLRRGAANAPPAATSDDPAPHDSPDERARAAVGEGSNAEGVACAPLAFPARRRAKQDAASQNVAAPTRRRGKSLFELANNSCRWLVEGAIKWAVDRFLSHLP